MDIPPTINHKHHQIHITKIIKPPTSISNNINNSTSDSTNNAINSNGTYSNRKVFYSINKNELNFPSSSSSASSSAAVASSSAAINYNVNNKILSTVLQPQFNDHAPHCNANNENIKGNQIIPGSYLDSDDGYDHHRYQYHHNYDNNNSSNMKNDLDLNYAYDHIKSQSAPYQQQHQQHQQQYKLPLQQQRYFSPGDDGNHKKALPTIDHHQQQQQQNHHHQNLDENHHQHHHHQINNHITTASHNNRGGRVKKTAMKHRSRDWASDPTHLYDENTGLFSSFEKYALWDSRRDNAQKRVAQIHYLQELSEIQIKNQYISQMVAKSNKKYIKFASNFIGPPPLSTHEIEAFIDAKVSVVGSISATNSPLKQHHHQQHHHHQQQQQQQFRKIGNINTNHHNVHNSIHHYMNSHQIRNNKQSNHHQSNQPSHPYNQQQQNYHQHHRQVISKPNSINNSIDHERRRRTSSNVVNDNAAYAYDDANFNGSTAADDDDDNASVLVTTPVKTVTPSSVISSNIQYNTTKDVSATATSIHATANSIDDGNDNGNDAGGSGSLAEYSVDNDHLNEYCVDNDIKADCIVPNHNFIPDSVVPLHNATSSTTSTTTSSTTTTSTTTSTSTTVPTVTSTASIAPITTTTATSKSNAKAGRSIKSIFNMYGVGGGGVGGGENTKDIQSRLAALKKKIQTSNTPSNLPTTTHIHHPHHPIQANSHQIHTGNNNISSINNQHNHSHQGSDSSRVNSSGGRNSVGYHNIKKDASISVPSVSVSVPASLPMPLHLHHKSNNNSREKNNYVHKGRQLMYPTGVQRNILNDRDGDGDGDRIVTSSTITASTTITKPHSGAGVNNASVSSNNDNIPHNASHNVAHNGILSLDSYNGSSDSNTRFSTIMEEEDNSSSSYMGASINGHDGKYMKRINGESYSHDSSNGDDSYSYQSYGDSYDIHYEIKKDLYRNSSHRDRIRSSETTTKTIHSLKVDLFGDEVDIASVHHSIHEDDHLLATINNDDDVTQYVQSMLGIDQNDSTNIIIKDFYHPDYFSPSKDISLDDGNDYTNDDVDGNNKNKKRLTLEDVFNLSHSLDLPNESDANVNLLEQNDGHGYNLIIDHHDHDHNDQDVKDNDSHRDDYKLDQGNNSNTNSNNHDNYDSNDDDNNSSRRKQNSSTQKNKNKLHTPPVKYYALLADEDYDGDNNGDDNYGFDSFDEFNESLIFDKNDNFIGDSTNAYDKDRNYQNQQQRQPQQHNSEKLSNDDHHSVMSSNEFNHLINDYDNDEIYNSDYEDNNINNTFQDSLTYSPINSIRDPSARATNDHHHHHSDHDQHHHTTGNSNMAFEESSILYPYLVIDGDDDNDDDPTVEVIGKVSARANEAHISHTEHHRGDDDGGDQLDLYMTTERDYSNDYDDEFEDYHHTNDPDAEVKYDDGDHNQILQRYTNHFHHDNDNNDNDDDEVKHSDSAIAIPDLQQRHHNSHHDLSIDVSLAVNHDSTQSVPVTAVAVAVKREHLDSMNLQSETSYEYDTDDFESSIQLTFDTSRDGNDGGDNNEDGEASANDDEKANDTAKATDEFQFVDNVDDVDWNHFANGFAELYTGLYMDKKDNDNNNENNGEYGIFNDKIESSNGGPVKKVDKNDPSADDEDTSAKIDATANDNEKANDTTKATDEFQFVDNVDDVDWNHFANGFAELYTGLYMDKKDNDIINNNSNDGDSTDYKQQIHADNAIANGSLSNNQSFEYNDSFEVDDNDDDNVKGDC